MKSCFQTKYQIICITLHYITLSAFQTPPTPKVTSMVHQQLHVYTKYEMKTLSLNSGRIEMKSITFITKNITVNQNLMNCSSNEVRWSNGHTGFWPLGEINYKWIRQWRTANRTWCRSIRDVTVIREVPRWTRPRPSTVGATSAPTSTADRSHLKIFQQGGRNNTIHSMCLRHTI